MQVLFDYQIFDAQKIGGISRYFCELARGSPEVKLGLSHTRNTHLLASEVAGIEGWPHKAGVGKLLEGANFPGANKLQRLHKRLGRDLDPDNRGISLDMLRSGRFDVFHPTYYDPYFLEALGSKPFVLTIHDMIHELYPELFESGDTTRQWKQVLASRASAIIAVSENTKRDIISYYDIDPSRIRVIYHGSDLGGRIPAAMEVPERYILFTGSRWGYKNFVFMVEALAPLLDKIPNVWIVCTGRPFTADESRLFRELGMDSKIIHRDAGDDEMYTLYSRALFFIFPSYYEGFGIPILEAFEAGCPALVARSSSLPEVGGDACLYFEPKDAASLRAGAEALIESAALRNSLAVKGRERVRQFSWERCRESTFRCYQELV